MGTVCLADAGTIVVHRDDGPVVSAPVLGSRLYTDHGIGERPVHVLAAPSQVPVDQVRDIGVVLHQQDGGSSTLSRPPCSHRNMSKLLRGRTDEEGPL